VSKLYDSVEAAPHPFDNLHDFLKHASLIVGSSGPDVLQKIERDGESYLDSSELRYWVSEIEIRQRKHDGSFEEVVNNLQYSLFSTEFLLPPPSPFWTIEDVPASRQGSHL
jgi:hypothetical protein